MRYGKELEKIPLTTAAFKEDTGMFSTEFKKGFGLWSLDWLWLCNKALIDQLVRSIRENIRDSTIANLPLP